MKPINFSSSLILLVVMLVNLSVILDRQTLHQFAVSACFRFRSCTSSFFNIIPASAARQPLGFTGKSVEEVIGCTGPGEPKTVKHCKNRSQAKHALEKKPECRVH